MLIVFNMMILTVMMVIMMMMNKEELEALEDYVTEIVTNRYEPITVLVGK